MKIQLLALALTILSTPFVHADTSSRPLAVFLLHGLSGNEKSFNDLPQVLESQFTTDQIRVNVLTYDTMNDKKGQFMFVDEIAPKMAAFYREQGLDMEKDPFAMIAHSQGGIIARNYLATCLRPAGTVAPSGTAGTLDGPWRDCFTKKGEPALVPRNMKLLITLATPHWGSPIGNRASDSKLIGVLGGGGYAQDKELAIGSTRMTVDRISMIKSFKKWQSMKTPINYFYTEDKMRFVSIAGNVGNDLFRVGHPYRFYLENIANTDINEDDLVVPCSMGNPNFHYYIEEDAADAGVSGAKNPIITESGYVRATDRVHLVPYPHTDANGPGLLFGNTTYFGISGSTGFDINEKLTVDKNGHYQYPHLPTLHVIKEVSRLIYGTGSKKTGSIDTALKTITATTNQQVKEFSSVITVKFPLGYQRRPVLSSSVSEVSKYITMSQKFMKTEKEGRLDVINFPNSIAFKNFGFNNSGADKASKPQFAFFHAGRFADKDAIAYGQQGAQATICYDINLPGYLPKHFCNTVRPGESSYAQIIMEPFRPFLKINKLQMNSPLILADNTMLLGYDDTLDKVTTLDFSDRTVKSRAWKDIEPVIIGEYVTMNPTTINDLKKQCYYAITGKQIGAHTNSVFASPTDTSAVTDDTGIPNLLPQNTSLKIVGRYTGPYPTKDMIAGPESAADFGGGILPSGLDRYLIQTDLHENFWINADDIDILDKKCR